MSKQTPGLEEKEPEITPQQHFPGFNHFWCQKGTWGTKVQFYETAKGLQCWGVTCPDLLQQDLHGLSQKPGVYRKTERQGKGDWCWWWTELSLLHAGGWAVSAWAGTLQELCEDGSFWCVFLLFHSEGLTSPYHGQGIILGIFLLRSPHPLTHSLAWMGLPPSEFLFNLLFL